MAKMTMKLPTEVINDIERIYSNADKIFGEMTKAGAEAVASTVRATAPLPVIAQNVAISKTYKTPTDDGINTKVYFRGTAREGAFTRRGRVGGKQYTTHKGVPVEFVAMVTEYGTSPRYTNNGAYRGYIGKKPYFRKAFKKDQIERIMFDVQRRESRGLLTDE